MTDKIKQTAKKFYNQKWVQEAIIDVAAGKEFSHVYATGAFGKRPDMVKYLGDITELVKQGATSFHVSEETWNNVIQLKSGMRKKELDILRKSWDFIIDIDSHDWKLSKVAAWIIVKTLQEEGVKNISCKFSGNKGFHIAVPFESFPKEINSKLTKDLFPELPKAVAGYLISTIEKRHLKITSETVSVGDRIEYKISDLEKLMKNEKKELYVKVCADCGVKITKDVKTTIEFVCPHCEHSKKVDQDVDYLKCERCEKLMTKSVYQPEVCECGSNNQPVTKFNVLSIIDVDTMLLSSRHMFRSVYSLHEKSGLVSVPVELDKILEFNKTSASPDSLVPSKTIFLDRSKSVPNETSSLFEHALAFQEILDKKEEEIYERSKKVYKKFEGHVPKELFPPCITTILKGIDDGKKRAIFILINFLRSCGWSDDLIRKELFEWNERNPMPLKQGLILGQLKQLKIKKENNLPPNCANAGYYKDFGVCKPDGICQRIKNPVNYAKRKYFFSKKKVKK